MLDFNYTATGFSKDFVCWISTTRFSKDLVCWNLPTDTGFSKDQYVGFQVISTTPTELDLLSLLVPLYLFEGEEEN